MQGVRIVARVLLLLFLLPAAMCSASAQGAAPRTASGRIALVIDNDGQPGEPAASPSLQRIADQLGRLGFATTKLGNARRAQMAQAIRDVPGQIREGSTVLLVFRGPMLRVGQKNVIMPADAAEAAEDDVNQVGFALDAIENEFSRRGAGIKIIVVDAVNNEAVAERFGSAPGGVAPLELHENTLAILNASRGRRIDGEAPADEDLFLGELLKQTAIPNVTAEQAFAKTRVAVARATGGRQVPSVASSLLNDFYFATDKTVAAPPPAPEPARPRPPEPAPTPRPAPKAAEAAPKPPPAPPATPKPGEIFKDCESCPEVVVVPAGDATIGSNDDFFEKPPHKVSIGRPFAIGRHEVTFAQWDACAAAGACRSDIDDHGYGRGRQPVIDVSWDEVQAYLKWLSAQTKQTYRLPSEAEWEYAARAGSRSAFPWGAAAGIGKANCEDCSTNPARAPQTVGSYRPNAFGLFDTVGNAAEWVDDCWNTGYRGAPADGSSWRAGQCQMRVLRGGSFAAKAAAARSSARFRYDHDVRYYTNGFRVLRELPAGG